MTIVKFNDEFEASNVEDTIFHGFKDAQQQIKDDKVQAKLISDVGVDISVIFQCNYIGYPIRSS